MDKYYVEWKIENVRYSFEWNGDIKVLWKQALMLVRDGRRNHIKCKYIVRDNMTGEKLFYLYSRRASNGRYIAKLNAVGKYGRHHTDMFF